MTIELWTAATPNGWKVSIMIEELKEAGVALPEVEVHTVSLGEGEQFSDVFTAISPNQKIPGLVHGAQRLMESCAILNYLGETFPSPLLPLDERKWEVLQWVYWQAANLGPVFGNKLSYTRYINIEKDRKSHPLERFSTEAQRLLGVFSRQLGEKPYLCGDEFTVADIASYPWVRGWKWSKIDITGFDNVVAWVQRVRGRPAVERGLKYGMSPEEVDKWTAETKARYARLGASIASNEALSKSK